MSSMAARLAQVEKINAALWLEVKEKTNKIEDLQIWNASLEAMKQGDLIDKYDAVLMEKNKLVQQVKEMEEFLADYGLKWIGKENH